MWDCGVSYCTARGLILRLLAMVSFSAFGATAEPMELGPLPTREMFPMFLMTQAYRPIDPTPVGRGRWRFSLEAMRANTFEFSEVFKERAPDSQERMVITRAFMEAHSAKFADVPLVFYFDEEIFRVEARVRYGLTDHTDLWLEVPFQSHFGGALDGLIEGFHKLGLAQFGRDYVQRDQLTLVVLEHGKVTFFNQERIRGKTQDPTVGLVHRFLEQGSWRASAHFALKPPMTQTYGVFRSGWDPTLGVSARFQSSILHVFYGGLGYVARTSGSAAYNRIGDEGFRRGWGAHGTWEYRPRGKWRPFIQLYWQSGYLKNHPYQMLDKPSLQHDLGVHWQFHSKAVMSFRYLNNITHNANTADMGLGLSLTMNF